MHLRGKRLKLEAVDVVGYGLLAGRLFPDAADLPLKTGAVYRKSEAYAAVEALQSEYRGSTDNVQVDEDDMLTRDGELRVTFQLLGYPHDTVIINGKEFHSRAAEQ